jgi:hypothetical protein
MILKITRRKFGQLALAGTAVAGLGYFANRTLAQTPSLTVLGISPGVVIDPNNNLSPEVNTTELDSPTASSNNVARIPQGLVLKSIDVATKQIQTPQISQTLANGDSILYSGEAITGFAALPNGTLVIAITPTSTSKKETDPTRLAVLGTSSKVVPIQGLKKQEELGDLAVTNDGGLIGFVYKKNRTPPDRLVDIDPQTGQISDKDRVKIPGDQRLITLTSCPDGTIYAVATRNDGTTNLVKLDQGQKKPLVLAQLSLNNQPWNSGLSSLICLGGQLFAVGAPRYAPSKYLYSINTSNGSLTQLLEFDVAMATASLA